MIKTRLLKFSLLVLLSSNFIGFIKAQEIKAQKQSFGKRALEWVKANPGKTIAIAAVTIATIGGGIYSGRKIYKYNQAKKQIEKEIMAADDFKKFEKSAHYASLSDQDKKKLIQEEISYATYTDNFLKQYGLPPFASIYSIKQGSAEEIRLGVKIEEILTPVFQEELISKNISDPKEKEEFIYEKFMKGSKKISAKINREGSSFKKKYPLAIKDDKFANSAGMVETVMELIKSKPK